MQFVSIWNRFYCQTPCSIYSVIYSSISHIGSQIISFRLICVLTRDDNLSESFLTWPVLFSYSKIGYAGNMQPQCIIPSCIAVKEYGKIGNRESRRLGTGLDDLNFFIGDEAIAVDGKNDFSLKVTVHFRES